MLALCEAECTVQGIGQKVFDLTFPLTEDGADIISFDRRALACPDLPRSFAAGSPLKAFGSKMLAPIANIKEEKLPVLATQSFFAMSNTSEGSGR